MKHALHSCLLWGKFSIGFLSWPELRKIIFIMKLTVFIILLISLKVNATAYSQEVTLNEHNEKIEKIFQLIRKQTGYNFLYKNEVLSKLPRVSIAKSGTLEHVLEELLNKQNLNFKIIEKTILVSKGRVGSNSKTAPFKDVMGIVKDSTGVTLIGVSVTIKNKPGKGTGTDVNGKFILNVEDSDILVFSYTGYVTMEVPVKGQTVINVVMKENNSVLDELVVVGFGAQKKISVVGAQASIKPADLQIPVRSLNNALGGRVAGIVSVQRSGEPGGGDNADIWIRGISTFSNNLSKPLVLVDDVPRSFSDVDPEDIESFSILKDASATAVYGVRGANGVIIVKTKSGTPGKSKFNFRYNEAITSFTKLPEFADGVTYMRMSNEALANNGAPARYSDDAIQLTQSGADRYLYPNVNWYKELFNDFGSNRRANLNINGGSERAVYYVATSYYDEKGMYKTDELANYDSQVRLKRYNLTSNITLKPTSTTTIKLGVQGYLSNVNFPGSNSEDIFEKAFFMTPILHPTKYEDGKIADVATSSVQNPYALLTQTGYANQWRNQLFSNLRLTQELNFLTKGLSVTGMFSFDAYNYVSLRRTKTPDTWLANGRDAEGNIIYQPVRQGTEYLAYERVNTGSRTFYNEAALNYSRTFGKHSLGAMTLFNQSDEINTQAGSLETSLPYRFRGLAMRTTYGFDNKYFAEFNFGYNGSENFLPEKRYGFFPSVGLGYVISEEGFFSSIKNHVQLLKIRGSHGKVGNSNIGGRRFAYLGTVKSTSGVYGFGRTPKGFNGLDIDEFAVDVTWETSTKTNLGLDLNTFNNNLVLQLDVFREHREGIFLRRNSLPSYVGILNNPYANVGIIDNKGIDGSVTYNGKIGKDFSFQLMGNFTFNRNKIVEDDLPDPAYPWLATKGLKVGQRQGYLSLGYFQSQEEIQNSPRQAGTIAPGDLKFKDLNGDGVIDAYDKTAIGYGQVPELMYGFGFTLGYKAITLSTLFQGVGNMDIWLNGEGLVPFQQGLSRGNLFNNIEDRWTKENPNPNAFYPRLTPGTINENYTRSTHWIANGRYIRLKTLQLNYKLPKSFVNRVKLKNADIFFSGVNLLTFSPFKLWDAELGDGSDAAYPGGAKYPNTATYSMGINVNF